jgi:hypothetical protein
MSFTVQEARAAFFTSCLAHRFTLAAQKIQEQVSLPETATRALTCVGPKLDAVRDLKSVQVY